MNAMAFGKNILDYTHILNVEEALVMTSSDDSHNQIVLGLLDIIDKTFMILYTIAIALYLVTIVLFAEYILVKKECLLQRVSSIIFHLFGILNGKG